MPYIPAPLHTLSTSRIEILFHSYLTIDCYTPCDLCQDPEHTNIDTHTHTHSTEIWPFNEANSCQFMRTHRFSTKFGLKSNETSNGGRRGHFRRGWRGLKTSRILGAILLTAQAIISCRLSCICIPSSSIACCCTCILILAEPRTSGRWRLSICWLLRVCITLLIVRTRHTCNTSNPLLCALTLGASEGFASMEVTTTQSWSSVCSWGKHNYCMVIPTCK